MKIFNKFSAKTQRKVFENKLNEFITDGQMVANVLVRTNSETRAGTSKKLAKTS